MAGHSHQEEEGRGADGSETEDRHHDHHPVDGFRNDRDIKGHVGGGSARAVVCSQTGLRAGGFGREVNLVRGVHLDILLNLKDVEGSECSVYVHVVRVGGHGPDVLHLIG